MAKSKLLIIGDETAIRSKLRKHFADEGYQVAEVDSSIEALSQFRDFQPDAAILDSRLVDEDESMELIARIRLILPDVSIVILTTLASADQAVLAIIGGPTSETADVNLSLAEVERRYIEVVLRQSGGNIEKAAGALGISRSSLYERVKRYRIR